MPCIDAIQKETRHEKDIDRSPGHPGLRRRLSASGVHAEESQGVTKTEITLASIQDLSGPLAGFGSSCATA